jgi:hypothetical protein
VVEAAPDRYRMQRRLSARLRYLTLAIATIGLGLAVHLRGTSLSAVLRDVLGDALWAVVIVWGVSVVAPSARRITRGGVALAICFAVETSQLYHAPTIDALRATTGGRLVLGSGFDLRDLAAYAAGVIAAELLEAAVRRRPFQND